MQNVSLRMRIIVLYIATILNILRITGGNPAAITQLADVNWCHWAHKFPAKCNIQAVLRDTRLTDWARGIKNFVKKQDSYQTEN
jgi:hypothetical protein